MDVQDPNAAAHGHPIMTTGSRHSDTETLSSLITNRHASCDDCHNPHAARSGRHVFGTSTAPPALVGAIGVKPMKWPSSFASLASRDYTTARIMGNATDVEAWVCFKCHSNAGGQLPTTVTNGSDIYTPTDVAQEFNPNNFSFHNVTGETTSVNRNASADTYTFKDATGVVRNQIWQFPTANVFTNGMTRDAPMACTDCHIGGTSAEAVGPHGSSVKWMLDPAYPANWENAAMSENTTAYPATSATPSYVLTICGKCHAGLTNANSAHASSHHTTRGCTSCHIAIPHGWKRPRMLISYTVDQGTPYVASGRNASNTLASFSATVSHIGTATISWPEGSDCTACNGQHTGGSTYYMP
jgi:hypothetical protein